MRFQGVNFQDLTPEQLDAAEDYTARAIAEQQANLELLRTAYEEIGLEYQRRSDFSTDRTLN